MYGWTGKILHIDLTKRKTSTEPTARYSRDFIGGRGINVKILFDGVGPQINPFEPENILIFGVGPLAGTVSPCSARTEVTSKSPNKVPKGLIGESNFGGYWGPELKFAGYDHLVIRGKAEKPTYVWIDNENVEFKDATHIWGKDTYETQALIWEELGDPEAKVVCIGPAGEKLVRFATIQHETKFAAGRTGMGAVMGSKNLKAITVRGTKVIVVTNPPRFLELCEKAHRAIKEHKACKTLSELGTSWLVDSEFVGSASGVIGNYERTTWEPLLKYARGQPFAEEYATGMHGCFGCPVHCMHRISVPGIGSGSMACQAWMCFTSPVWNTDMKTNFEAVLLCNKYGMDIGSSSYVLAFLMELYDKGIINEKDTDGIPMERGSKEAIISTIHKIGRRDGFGDLLAEGAWRVAEKIGKGAEKYALCTKGLEPAHMELRAFVGHALASAVDVRGDITRSGPQTEWSTPNEFAVVKKMFGTEKAAIPREYEGKAATVVYYENLIACVDMLSFCKWIVPFSASVPLAVCSGRHAHSYKQEISLHLPINLFTMATGLPMNEQKMFEVAERVRSLERAFDAREGLTRKDDTLPERFFKDPVQDGKYEGAVLDKSAFEKMKDEYYRLRGWDVKTGIPTMERLKELGLNDVAEELAKLRKIQSQ